MKHVIKKMKILLYICLAIFLLYSCTEEKEYLKNNRELKVEEKSFKELLLLKDFNTAYQRVKTEKQKSIASRSALEDEYNFTIVEDKDVKIMDVDGKTFYNILIQRDSVAANFFENLLIMVENKKGAEELSAYIIKYAPQKYEGTNIYNFEENVDKDLTTIFGRITNECDEVCTTLCWDCIAGTEYAFPHPPSSDCDLTNFIFTTCSTVCTDYQGGSLGGGTTWTGGSLNTGSGSSSSSEIVTAPVYGGTLSDGEEKTPCKTLKKKSNEAKFKQKFNELNNPDNFLLHEEKGFGESRNSANQIIYPTLSASPGEHSLNVPQNLNCYSFTHVHTNEWIDKDGDIKQCVLMFSPEDVHTFNHIAQYTSEDLGLTYQDSYAMMISSQGTYALKMIKPLDIDEYIDYDKFNKEFARDANRINLNNPDNLKKMFLKYLKLYNLDDNIGLYEATFIPSIPSVPLWRKVNLIDKSLSYSPC